jgi:fluoride ion exporter CrcB/FEX
VDPFQALIGIKTTHFIAGIAGGIVRAFLAGEGWIAAMSSVVVGTLTASYVGPMAIGYLPISMIEKGELAVVFLTGVSGMFVCEGVLKFAKRWSDNPTLPGK